MDPWLVDVLEWAVAGDHESSVWASQIHGHGYQGHWLGAH